MAVALIVTPQGFPLAYEVMAGNTSDKTTLADFLEKIESQYGRSERVWIMDRGIPTEQTLAGMRAGESPVHYLVGTPKGRLTRLEQAFVGLPWCGYLPEARQAVTPETFTFSLRRESRIEAHIFVAFIAYCLHVTLKNLARPRAPGLTPRAILEKFSTMQMVDVHLPTTDGRQLVLPRHTQPERDRQLLLDQLKLRLPEQPSPRIST